MAMKTLRFALLASLLAFVIPAAAQELPQLFKQAQQEFAGGKYAESLVTLDRLDAASRAAGLERDRAQLEPVIAFYRGASLAQLGRRQEAKEQFEIHLTLNPRSEIKDGAFPKKVEQAFRETRQEMAERVAARANSLESVYASFRPVRSLAYDTTWADSPVRKLMTRDEAAAWEALETDAARLAFIDEFWSRRDPSPGTPENEFRAEFERRILFAESVFSSEELAGRRSERALVFTFLGPPTFVGRAQLSREDGVEALRGRAQGMNLSRDRRIPASKAKPLATEFEHGFQETWQYRSGDVPEPLAFPDLQIKFVTRKGYGTDVLQKEAEVLQAIDLMIAAAAKTLQLP